MNEFLMKFLHGGMGRTAKNNNRDHDQGFIQPPRRGGELPPETNLLRPLDRPAWQFHTPPWNKRLDKALIMIRILLKDSLFSIAIPVGIQK